MTNPACRFPRVYFECNTIIPDGFLRSGNAPVDFDFHIDAAKLKVFKFLALPYAGSTLLEHLKRDNYDALQDICDIDKETAIEWNNRLKYCITSQDYRSHNLIKQVMFPSDKSYHQLSLLQPSGLVFQLKERIDKINSRSTDAYSGRKSYKEGSYYANGYKTIPNITVTTHGGEHPKNISALNNKHQKCYLLSSVPPLSDNKSVIFPKKDFFRQTLSYNDCKDNLLQLDSIFKIERNEKIPLKNIQKGRNRCLGDILDTIIQKMIAVRAVSSSQYSSKNSQLKAWQRTWLCQEYEKERIEHDQWLNTLCYQISTWINNAYKHTVKQAVLLGEAERMFIQEFIEEHKEVLR